MQQLNDVSSLCWHGSVVFYADPPFDDIKVLGWRREEHFPMVGMNIAMKRKVPKHG
jgi:hypothetical protein